MSQVTPLIGRKSRPQYYRNLRIKADGPLHAQIAETIADVAEPGASVLDFGSGEGALCLRLKDGGYDVVACDIDEANFKCSGEIHFQKLDNSQDAVNAYIEENADRFDVILGIEIIEHVENPWDYIRNLGRMVKPGGHVIVSTPNVTSKVSRFEYLFKGRLFSFSDRDVGLSGHINPLTAWELRLIMTEAGYRDVQVRPAGRLPFIMLSKKPRIMVYNLLHFVFRPFMRGVKDGWCTITVAQKPSEFLNK